MLKESGRERINAVYGTKEQCRKEFQDEIVRLRHQFQLVRTNLFLSREKTVPVHSNDCDCAFIDHSDAFQDRRDLLLRLGERCGIRSDARTSPRIGRDFGSSLH